MKEHKKDLIWAIPMGVALVFVFGFFLGGGGNLNTEASDSGATIGYGSSVCVAKNSEAAVCSHNNLTDLGRGLIQYLLVTVGPTGAPPYNITLGNGTTTVYTDTALPGLLDGGQGMTGGNGTVVSNAAVSAGNWTITKTFTATSNAYVNTTGLYGANATNYIFFAGNNFTGTTMQANDQITVNWTIYVSR
jgi:hypothetical protein